MGWREILGVYVDFFNYQSNPMIWAIMVTNSRSSSRSTGNFVFHYL